MSSGTVVRGISLPARFELPLGRYLADQPAAFVIERRSFELELRSPGRLVPWLGPALRGITALRFRAAQCRQPQAEWTDRWRHCRGCPHLPACGYGIAFEPEALAAGSSDQLPALPDAAGGGRIDAIRSLVMAPEFPAPVAGQTGSRIPVVLTSIGGTASATIDGIVAAMAAAGRHDGLGPNRVRFAIVGHESPSEEIRVDAACLPRVSPASPRLPRVTIRLQGPLFLRERESGHRRQILNPDFRALVRSAVRIIHEFLPAAAIDSPAEWEDLASGVAKVAADLRPFRQERASRRTFQRFEASGVCGWCTFADVPACFLPWLVLAGMLHIGGHRIAGAGGWTVDTTGGP